MTAWQKRKLGEIGTIKSGVGFPDKEQGGLEGIPFFKVSDMNLKDNSLEMLSAKNYVTEMQLNQNNWKPLIPFNMGIIFAKVGAAVFLGRKRIVNKPFLIDNNMMYYQFADEWVPYFGKTLFDTISLLRLVQIGALPSLNGKDMENMVIHISSIEEQNRIAFLFQSLDTLITVNQRKNFYHLLC
nr:restriction endonuclease subunit S [Convivina intestini]